MAFSFDPMNLIRVLRNTENKRQEKVLVWLEAVRIDTRRLSDAWLEISDQIDECKTLNTEDIMRKHLIYVPGHKATAAMRLTAFYRNATLALGGGIRDHRHEVFITSLTPVLASKTLTKATFETALEKLKRDKTLFFINDENKAAEVKTLRDTANALRKELESLDAFIATVEANPNVFR